MSWRTKANSRTTPNTLDDNDLSETERLIKLLRKNDIPRDGCSRSSSCHPLREGWPNEMKAPVKSPSSKHSPLVADFINTIDPTRTSAAGFAVMRGTEPASKTCYT
jgi:hypothetical protein